MRDDILMAATPPVMGAVAMLAKHELLRTAEEAALDAAVQLAVQMFDVPAAAIVFVAAGTVVLKASHGVAPQDQPGAFPLLVRVVERGESVFINDGLLADPLGPASLPTEAEPFRFFAGVPLALQDGDTVGSFFIADTNPRPDFDGAKRKMFEGLSLLVTSRIALLHQAIVNRRLAEQSALRAHVMAVAAEAPDFPAAIAGASAVLMQSTDAVFCHVFRLAPDGVSASFINGAARHDTDALERMRGLFVSHPSIPVVQALVSGQHLVRQALEVAAGEEPLLQAAEALAAAQIVCKTACKTFQIPGVNSVQ